MQYLRWVLNVLVVCTMISNEFVNQLAHTWGSNKTQGLRYPVINSDVHQSLQAFDMTFLVV